MICNKIIYIFCRQNLVPASFLMHIIYTGYFFISFLINQKSYNIEYGWLLLYNDSPMSLRLLSRRRNHNFNKILEYDLSTIIYTWWVGNWFPSESRGVFNVLTAGHIIDKNSLIYENYLFRCVLLYFAPNYWIMNAGKSFLLHKGSR